MKLIALVALLSLGSIAVQDMPKPAAKLEQHQWLQQLVGEWTVTTDITMAGAPPMQVESTESVRSIGGLWIVGEGSASFGEMAFTSLLTLGYDPDEKTFVGSWIDTMHTRMWTYTGTLDAGKKVLTLSAEGPTHGDATKISQYRDVLELKGPDEKVMTSSIQNEDGTWTTFMTATYRRKAQ